MKETVREPILFRKDDDCGECGAYQLRAVLNIFGQDASVKSLYYSSSHQRKDWSLPWLMPKVLDRYGIKSTWHFRFQTSFKSHVIASLERGQPVLFVIHSILGKGRIHWISAWDYDSATNEFLCYDSKAPELIGTLGNTRYKTSTLISHLPWFGTFTLTFDSQ